jgi:hypothetical protein
MNAQARLEGKLEDKMDVQYVENRHGEKGAQ